MLAEIINPSDQYIIEGEWPVICAATMILGEGRYGLDGEGGRSMPVFILGGALEWFAEEFSQEPGEFVKQRALDIAAALESVTLGSIKDRQLFQEAMNAIDDPEKRSAFRASWDDKRRSSMNNIWAMADAYAKSIRQKFGESEKART